MYIHALSPVELLCMFISLATLFYNNMLVYELCVDCIYTTMVYLRSEKSLRVPFRGYAHEEQGDRDI